MKDILGFGRTAEHPIGAAEEAWTHLDESGNGLSERVCLRQQLRLHVGVSSP